MPSISRRELLQAAGLAGASFAFAYPTGRRLADAEPVAAPLGVRFDPGPFTLGVASFDPSPDGVLLWTRVAPEPLLPAGHDGSLPEQLAVQWTVREATTNRVVASGTAPAAAELHHTVHVVVDGLDPATTYLYDFAALGHRSVTGRTRTAPLPDDPRPVSLAWVGCSKFHNGYFTPYDHLAREDVDLVLCTGDYIYEEGFEGGNDLREEDRPAETLTLEDYRARYAIYRGDPKLREVHRRFPWVVTWDDHEVDNNYAGYVSEEKNAQFPDHPPIGVRRSNGYRAHFEYLPGRQFVPTTGGGTLGGPVLPEPHGPDYGIYRRMRYGLLDLVVTDTRQYRTDQPCGDEQTRQDPTGTGLGNPTGLPVAVCDEFDDPDATILGEGQRQWLLDELERSTADWRVLLNAVMVSSLRFASAPDSLADQMRPVGEQLGIGSGAYINPDQWDGYAAERRVLLEHLAEHEITDTVVLTGDIHSNWVSDLPVDFDDPSSPLVATEFVGTSITSNGFSAEEEQAFRTGLYPTHNHLRFTEGQLRGYSVATVTPDDWTTRMVAVDSVSTKTAIARTLAEFVVNRGAAGAEVVSGDGASPFPRVRTGR